MDNYSEIFDSYLMHSNRPGSHWYQHKYGKWQSQAVYAQGQTDPDAKVRGEKEKKTLSALDKVKYNLAQSKEKNRITTLGYNNSKELARAETLLGLARLDAMHELNKGAHDRLPGSGPGLATYALLDDRMRELDNKAYKLGLEIDKKQQASAGVGKGKVEVLTKKAFNNLPSKDQARMHMDAALGENYEFNKRIRDSIQNEKDGSSGRIDTYMPTRGPAQLNWEKANGKVIFREPLFNRKVSDRYADKVLNRSMFGGYTRK